MRCPSRRMAMLASAPLAVGLTGVSVVHASATDYGARPLPALLAKAAAPPGAIEALNLLAHLADTCGRSRCTAPPARSPTRRTSWSASRRGSPGTNSSITLDFGKEVGGIATLSFGATSGGGQRVGLAFSESSLYVGNDSDISSGARRRATVRSTAAAPANGTYTMPTAQAARRLPLPDGVPATRPAGST